jgi:hypothetical protein
MAAVLSRATRPIPIRAGWLALARNAG